MSGGGFVSPGGCAVPTTKAEVMLAIVRKIRASIAVFSSPTSCFLSSDVAPDGDVVPTLFCTVSPGGGDFGNDVIGGGPWGIEQRLSVNVGVWVRISKDRPAHSDYLLTDGSRGLFALEHQILIVLAGQQLYREDEHPLLEQVLTPRRTMAPPRGRDADEFASAAITFDVVFRWDLNLPPVE